MGDIMIRSACPEDAEALRKIYAPYVEKTAITFEYEIPSSAEFADRMKKTLGRYPYLVAVKDGKIAGYAYTGPFVGRTAYDRSVETTIYLSENERGNGIGRALYSALEEVTKAQKILNLYACIGYPDKDDEYLTKNSAQFHAHLGYTQVGLFRDCGYKFGRWYHMIWMEKMLGEHTDHPEEVIDFQNLSAETLSQCGIVSR